MSGVGCVVVTSVYRVGADRQARANSAAARCGSSAAQIQDTTAVPASPAVRRPGKVVRNHPADRDGG
ncbi:hypothetical protein GCM10010977_24190 [Citricoccus zhacaiensis]|uniref:Uncharacterized protein n=1 Tax=Citricoccus zhacaiensis TaxID=489142 RepID=A0ABQ2M536_9MICC|nr:hypothetical protein GCM10010977_24190 [Citricoccus zhacaiensis]